MSGGWCVLLLIKQPSVAEKRCSQAPGEAEAELAMLSLRGDIDLIITDDVDSLLFGATRVCQ